MEKVIATFQNGTNIIGQPEYVSIVDLGTSKGRGLKIKTYTQKNFVESIRSVVHKIFVGFVLVLGIVSCNDPEEVLYEDIYTPNTFISDSRFHGVWKHTEGFEHFVISYHMLDHTNDDSTVSNSYSSHNAHATVSGNVLKVNTQGGQLQLKLINSGMIEFEGKYFLKN